MKTALHVSTVAGTINKFEIQDMKILQEMGYTVHCAASDDGQKTSVENLESEGMIFHPIPFSRSPFNKTNLIAYFKIKHLMEIQNFNIIHCHTPIAGAIVRVAAHKLRKKGLKVIYTAHGFHFYDAAPLKNWLLYFPVEAFCSRMTDVLITINRQDFNRAKHHLHAKRNVYIPGVGFDSSKFHCCLKDRHTVRAQIGVADDSFLIVSVGEVNENKNHEIIIRAISDLRIPSIQYVICGEGSKIQELKNLSEHLSLENQVKLLGFCQNINDILHAADCFAFPSKREGLGMAALEAMAAGLPLVTSDVGGIKDYMSNGKTGFVCNPMDVKGFSEGIRVLYSDRELCKRIGKHCRSVSEKFDRRNTEIIMRKIYEEID